MDFNYKEHEIETVSNKADSDTKKHVRPLNGLALLFVRAKVGDVCVTAFVLDGKSATIYWAKNNPTSLPLIFLPYLRCHPLLILTHLQQLLIIQINS